MSDSYDYRIHDRIEIAVKRGELQRLLGYYELFGWRELERRDGAHLGSVVHVELLRPHKIPNKDKLQLLQVKMEATVNSMAIAKRNKHLSSLFAGLGLSLCAIALIALGLPLAFAGRPALGIPLFSLGAALSFAAPLVVRRLLLREERRYSARYKAGVSEILRTLNAAVKLRGQDSDEK